MNHQVSCCIIGDVNIDYITDLTHIVVNSDTNACFYNPIMLSVGGNSVFFAEAACEAGFKHVTVLCSIGNDIGGERARGHLQRLGVTVHTTPSSQQTGQVIILYQPNNRRIMVADRGANRDFRIPETIALSELVDKSNLLYISGYMLLNTEQRTAVHAIADAFRAANAKVIVDMVPHDVWRTLSWTEYVDMCSCADCVAVEMSTVSAFHREVSDALQPEEAARLLLRNFEFCLIRINDVSDFIIADRRQQRFVTVPYRRTIASLRFTDRIIACAMQQYVTNSRLLFQSNRWLESAIEIVSGGSYLESIDDEKIAQQNQKAYNALAVSYAKQWAKVPDLPLADEFLGMLHGNKILDIGCGPGHYSSYFMDRGYWVEAIDTSSEMLRLAVGLDPRIQIRMLDMSKLDYGESEFDGLWVCASLPHIPKESVSAVLQSFRRILKHDGCMLVNAIIGHLDYRVETPEEMGPNYREPGRFFQWYPTTTAFKEILEEAGFRVQVERHRHITSHVLEHARWRTNSWYNCFCCLEPC